MDVSLTGLEHELPTLHIALEQEEFGHLAAGNPLFVEFRAAAEEPPFQVIALLRQDRPEAAEIARNNEPPPNILLRVQGAALDGLREFGGTLSPVFEKMPFVLSLTAKEPSKNPGAAVEIAPGVLLTHRFHPLQSSSAMSAPRSARSRILEITRDLFAAVVLATLGIIGVMHSKRALGTGLGLILLFFAVLLTFSTVRRTHR
ncbi:MAG: hypothetical protein JW797_08680 [Bradymonadales bacterium]|nr:hypothetical protein [Bradymonadales bacterium]